MLQQESECQPSLIVPRRLLVIVILQVRQFSSAEGKGWSNHPKSGTVSLNGPGPDQTQLPEKNCSCSQIIFFLQSALYMPNHCYEHFGPVHLIRPPSKAEGLEGGLIKWAGPLYIKLIIVKSPYFTLKCKFGKRNSLNQNEIPLVLDTATRCVIRRFNLSSRTKNLLGKRERNKAATCNGPLSLVRTTGFLDLYWRLL